MLSISTSWNYKPDMDFSVWLDEVQGAGIKAVELGYSLKRVQLEALIPLLEERGMAITSLHNFCPLPDDGPSPRHGSNYYRLSSLDEEERKRAVIWTQKAIDTAQRVKAPVVIVHAGTIELNDDSEKKFLSLYREGKKGTKDFEEEKDRLLKKRKELKSAYLEAVEKSFEEIMPYAQERNIKIGLENRYYPVEIPNYEEIGCFLNRFSPKGMFYWHDVGHAEMYERLTLTNQIDFLKSYEDKLIGIHLHGFDAIKDHLVPFAGDMDLLKIKPFLKDNIVKVIESHYGTPQQMEEAVRRLKELSSS